MPCVALHCVPFGTSCTVGPCEVRKGCGKRICALRCSTLQSSTILSPRDVAAPVVAASYPVATARKQDLPYITFRCFALPYTPIVALRPRSGQRLPAGPVRLQATLCRALPCIAIPYHSLLYLPICPCSYSVDCAPDMGYKICSPCEKNNPCSALICSALLCSALRCCTFQSLLP